MSALLCAALLLGQYTPEEAQALFVEANEAALAKDTAKAKATYKKLVDAGQAGADVLYNLGTTHLMANELGPAVLYLERSKRLEGGDDVDAQLALARARQLDRVIGEAAEAPFAQRLAHAVDERLAGYGLLVAVWLGIALAWIAWATKSGWLGAAASLMLVTAAALAGLVATQAYVASTVQEAVVMPEVVSVRDAPRENARTAFEVHAGLKVRRFDTVGDFTRIRLPNALEGWVEANAIEAL